MTIKSLFLAGGCVVGLVAQPLSAQSLSDWERTGRAEVRATASVTIPLGGGNRAEETAPRIDFAMQNDRFGGDDYNPMRFDVVPQVRRAQRQSVVSFTLDNHPKMLVNGQKVATFGPTLTRDGDGEVEGGDGISTGAAIGIGAAVVLVVVVLAGVDGIQDDFDGN